MTPLLHEHGLRTYAPDQRGYSQGARPTRRRDYALQKLVDDAVALIETIGRPVHLVGHDWGSSIGWIVAAQRPDLVRTLDRRVGAAPEGLPARDAHVPPGAEVLVHGRLPDPRRRPSGWPGRAGSTCRCARAG